MIAPDLCNQSALQLIEGNVCDFASPEGDFAYVVHGAASARASFSADHPLLTIATIVEGTRRVLEFAMGATTSRLLFLSSGAVYGQQGAAPERILETCSSAPNPTSPASAYGEAKRLAELLCACFHQRHGLESVIARCFSFVGPHLPLDGDFAVGNFVGDALQGFPIRVKGDGKAVRSYLYAADMAIWLWTLLGKGHPSCAYNVGSEEAVSMGDLARMVASCATPPVEVCLMNLDLPGLAPSFYVPSTEQACRELGLMPTVGLSEAIRKTLQWWESIRTTGASRASMQTGG